MGRHTKKDLKKELRKLADDFGLLYRDDVKNIIKNSSSYNEGQKEILKIYDKVYL